MAARLRGVPQQARDGDAWLAWGATGVKIAMLVGPFSALIRQRWLRAVHTAGRL